MLVARKRTGSAAKIGTVQEPYLVVLRVLKNESDYLKIKNEPNNPMNDLFTAYDGTGGKGSETGVNVQYIWYYNQDGTLNGTVKEQFQNQKPPFYAFLKGTTHEDYSGNGNDYQLITTSYEEYTGDELINIVDELQQVDEFTNEEIIKLDKILNKKTCPKIVKYFGVEKYVCFGRNGLGLFGNNNL